MIIYNLTSKEVSYKSKRIPPNGGSVNMPDLTFIPDRDRALEASKVLAFGSLPKWWHMEQAMKAAPSTKAATVAPKPSAIDNAMDAFPSSMVIVKDASDGQDKMSGSKKR